MNKFKLVLFTLVVAMIFASFSTVAFASRTMTIDSVVFGEYTDAEGNTDENLVNVTVSFTAVTAEQFTLLLTTENITEITEETKAKVIYIDQGLKPEDPYTYTFVIEKSRIAAATGLADIDGCNLYLKMGGDNLDSMASQTVAFEDPYGSDVLIGDTDGDGDIDALDAVAVLQYVAGWDLGNTFVTAAADTDADGEIGALDAVLVLQYVAGWDVTLGVPQN